MVLEVVYLGGMEVGATVLVASHDVVAAFVSTQTTGERVGVIGVVGVEIWPTGGHY